MTPDFGVNSRQNYIATPKQQETPCPQPEE